jgi:hypothetical protein
MTDPLTETERLTFGALLRTLIRLDGFTTPEEQTAVYRVAAELLPEFTTPKGQTAVYRVAAGLLPETPEADIRDALAALFERAAERYQDDESVRAAAEAITRTEARDAIYGALYEVSAAGTITLPESSLLDWLAARWEIAESVVDSPAG